MRLIAFGVFGWAAYISFARHEKILPWIFIVLALVYNPIIQVYFPNEIWIVINLLSVAFLVFNQRKFLEWSDMIKYLFYKELNRGEIFLDRKISAKL